ncbi:MAG: substrate-binding domain-containing protein [Microcoleaceae cyanobacterium]
MWHKQESSVVALSLLVALFLSPMATLLKSESTLAQPTKTESSPLPVKLPEEVPVDTNLRIDGSTSMAVINQALKQSFEENYPNAKVTMSYRGTDAALKALVDKKTFSILVFSFLLPPPLSKGGRGGCLLPYFLQSVSIQPDMIL